MKLLMAARRFPPDVWSGTETVFQALYEAARRGHEVRLVAGWQRSAELLPSEARAVRLRGLPKPLAWATFARAVHEEARRFRPDVVLSNNIEVPPTGVPTACIVHDLNFGGDVGTTESQLRGRFYALRARALDAVITVSSASARQLLALGVPEGRVHTIHNGVDLARFHPVRERPEDGVVRFAYPARVLPGKGQHHAIDAIGRLRRDYKQRASLTIAGAVADRPYLDQLRIQAYNQPVEFALDLPDLAPVYQQADVILFPSTMEEGFGFTAVEGMACGKPVIWFDQPAVREATGGVGIAVPRGDVDGLRAAMMRLMDDPLERATLGARGRAWCEERCSWTAAWERYELLLRALADRRPRTG